MYLCWVSGFSGQQGELCNALFTSTVCIYQMTARLSMHLSKFPSQCFKSLFLEMKRYIFCRALPACLSSLLSNGLKLQRWCILTSLTCLQCSQHCEAFQKQCSIVHTSAFFSGCGDSHVDYITLTDMLPTFHGIHLCTVQQKLFR